MPTTAAEKPHWGIAGLPFMNSMTRPLAMVSAMRLRRSSVTVGSFLAVYLRRYSSGVAVVSARAWIGAPRLWPRPAPRRPGGGDRPAPCRRRPTRRPWRRSGRRRRWCRRRCTSASGSAARMRARDVVGRHGLPGRYIARRRYNPARYWRMKLGTRVTVVTTLLVAAVLAGVRLRGAQGAAREPGGRSRSRGARDRRPRCAPASSRSTRGRRADRDAAAPARARARASTTSCSSSRCCASAATQRTDDDAWLLLDARGRHPGRAGRAAVRLVVGAALVRDGGAAATTPPRWSCRRATRRATRSAIMGMRRDAGYIDAEVAATARRIFPLFLLVVIGVAIGVRLALRQIGACGRCAACSRGSTPSARAICRASSWPSATTRSAPSPGASTP